MNRAVSSSRRPRRIFFTVERFLRSYHVEPKRRELPNLKLGDHDDLVAVGSALNSEAEILVTGDQEILDLEEKPQGLRILSPRDFCNLVAGRGKKARGRRLKIPGARDVKTIFELCRPRGGILKGDIGKADFAADLAQVVR